jgi:hypothetical protein
LTPSGRPARAPLSSPLGAVFLHLAEHVPHPRPQRAVHAACRAEVSPRCRRQVDRASLCWTAQRTARAFGSSAAAHDLLGLSGREKKTQTRLSANMRRPDAGPRGFLGCRSASWVLIVALAAVALPGARAAKNRGWLEDSQVPPCCTDRVITKDSQRLPGVPALCSGAAPI